MHELIWPTSQIGLEMKVKTGSCRSISWWHSLFFEFLVFYNLQFFGICFIIVKGVLLAHKANLCENVWLSTLDLVTLDFNGLLLKTMHQYWPIYKTCTLYISMENGVKNHKSITCFWHLKGHWLEDISLWARLPLTLVEGNPVVNF